MNDQRADSFLNMIRKSRRGRLKIYLGYAAGVGKTYQMLVEAHRLVEDGVDLVVGIVETHGRSETAALLSGLPEVPLKIQAYRGIDIREMDVDAVLERRPSVVLVDELAHTNVPGSRNAKRYQDVEEFLLAGIHVISTLNVQHIESLYNMVERATSVKVRERLPDHILFETDQIVNVDITTEDLRKRLKEGKIYSKERVETALARFFLTTNLEQLRELTLRELAAHIDSRRREPLSECMPSSPDQVMVCLSSRSPNSDALLRYASRLAGRLNRNWYALYVQTSREKPTVIDSETQRILSNTLTLAQELGAMVFTYKGDDIVKTILQFAREYRVGHIVTGSPGKKVPFLKRLLGEVSMMERLITEGRGHTVVVLDTRGLPEDMKKVKTSDAMDVFPEKGRKDYESPCTIPAFATAGTMIWDTVTDKDDAIRQLLNLCNREVIPDRDSVLAALFEREQKGGTFVGEDVVIPHARIEGLRRAVIAVGIGKSGIFDGESGGRASIMFLLLSPCDPSESHIAMLAQIGRLARDERFRRQILNADNPWDVARMIEEWGNEFQIP